MSIDNKGVNAAGGSSTSSTGKGTQYSLVASNESSQARTIVLSELLQYRNIEGKNTGLEKFLESAKLYNESLTRENGRLRQEISQLGRLKKPELEKVIKSKLKQTEEQ